MSLFILGKKKKKIPGEALIDLAYLQDLSLGQLALAWAWYGHQGPTSAY